MTPTVPAERLAAAEAALVSFEKLVDEAAQEGASQGSVWNPILHNLSKRIRSRLSEYGQRRTLDGMLANFNERLARLEAALKSYDHRVGHGFFCRVRRENAPEDACNCGRPVLRNALAGGTQALDNAKLNERRLVLDILRDAVKDMAARKDTDGKVYGQHTTIDPDDVLNLIESLRG